MCAVIFIPLFDGVDDISGKIKDVINLNIAETLYCEKQAC